MKKLLSVVFSVALALTGVVVSQADVVTVQAAEVNEEYSLDLKMVESRGLPELCTGDEVFATGELKSFDGKALDVEKWEYLTDDEMKAELKDHNLPLCFYSKHEIDTDAVLDNVEFNGTVPDEAFGKYVYKFFGANLVSDPHEGTGLLIRSENTITSWGDTDYLTFSLNNDNKTVTVYSIWECSSAHFPSKINVGNKTYKVTAIGDYALEDSEILSITIPSTITSVGKDAFINASKLKTITIEGDLKTVGKGAFSNINKNTVINIKASKSNYEKIVKKIKDSGVPKTVKFKRI